jgi:hypothetical protein
LHTLRDRKGHHIALLEFVRSCHRHCNTTCKHILCHNYHMHIHHFANTTVYYYVLVLCVSIQDDSHQPNKCANTTSKCRPVFSCNHVQLSQLLRLRLVVIRHEGHELVAHRHVYTTHLYIRTAHIYTTHVHVYMMCMVHVVSCLHG